MSTNGSRYLMRLCKIRLILLGYQRSMPRTAESNIACHCGPPSKVVFQTKLQAPVKSRWASCQATQLREMKLACNTVEWGILMYNESMTTIMTTRCGCSPSASAPQSSSPSSPAVHLPSFSFSCCGITIVRGVTECRIIRVGREARHIKYG